MKDDDLTYQIIGCAYRVHSALGPGLLESAYEACMSHELKLQGILFERQKPLTIDYYGEILDAGYRLDLLIERRIIVELKAVTEIIPIHQAQMMTYLKLSKLKLGLLLNFNVLDMKKGIKRLRM